LISTPVWSEKSQHALSLLETWLKYMLTKLLRPIWWSSMWQINLNQSLSGLTSSMVKLIGRQDVLWTLHTKTRQRCQTWPNLLKTTYFVSSQIKKFISLPACILIKTTKQDKKRKKPSVLRTRCGPIQSLPLKATSSDS
jgi:hypothetical protein